MVFRPELSWEFLSADEIEAKSVRAVRNHVRHVKEVSAYYRESLFDVFPDDIKSLSDIARLPFTDKASLAQRAASFQAVSEDLVVETMVTSGASAAPILFPLSATDMERLEFNEALSFYSAGVAATDRAQLLMSLDRLAMAPVAYYRGLAHLGVNTARVGLLSPEIHVRYLERLKPTVLVGAPSYLKKLATELARLNFDKSNSTVKKIFCTGEAVRSADMALNDLGKYLEDFFNASVFSTYLNTEMSSSFCDCQARCGGHGHPELLFFEIVNEAGAPAADGEIGELVATPLGVEGCPLVRYRTGDITFKMSGSCSCGRNSMRIGPILGCASQVIRMKEGVVHPLSLTTILDGCDGVEDYCIILENDESTTDRISLQVITPPANMEKIAGRIRSELRMTLPVLLSNKATIRHLRGTAGPELRILDNRKHGKTAGIRAHG